MSRRRKAHAKSRNGCVQCKERHVKCDEIYPECSNCARVQISCSYLSPGLTTMPLNKDSLADLELLEYWNRNPLIPGTSQKAKELEHGYVQLGFSHHYLLNSILSLAALQRFNEDHTRTRWYLRAMAHQQAAISRVRPHLQDLETSSSASHHKAILAFSTFTSLYAVVEPLLRPTNLTCNQPKIDPVAEFVRVLRIGRCTSVFVKYHLKALIAMDPFMTTKFTHYQPTITGNLEARFPQLSLLRSVIERLCEDKDDHRAACLHAARLVFAYMTVFLDSIGRKQQTQVIFAWANEVSSLFLELCSAQHPIALAILAHYAALMSFSRDIWFTQRWPHLLLEDIRDKLNDWEDIMQWPNHIILQNSALTSGV
ncbi:hypothetical protein BJX63DRAFT_171431 [Aspergillus granulosus]|uniref:Zn(2)-C6 fungal-type domain-containing protein n=1 Tax=Aspergillus granulosus TaxID=176169 RepID=A0ABR4HI70_9EURO